MNRIPKNFHYKRDRFLVRLVSSMGFGSYVADVKERLDEFDQIHRYREKSVVASLNAFLYTDYTYYVNKQDTDMSHVRRALKNLHYVDRITHKDVKGPHVAFELTRVPRESSMYKEFNGTLTTYIGLKDFRFTSLKEKK